MSDVSDYREHWERTYEEAYAKGRRHWRPELATPPAFVRFLESEWAPSRGARVLEAGCGDGLNGVYLARCGYAYTGVDVSRAAITRARQVAAEEGVEAEFHCLDLVRQRVPGRRGFDLWIDIKTLHTLWEDGDRQSYLASAAAALRDRGIFFLNCGLALAEVREHFPEVFDALDPSVQALAEVRDRELARDQRRGIRCETLDHYCRELEQAGLTACHATREASIQSGWGAIVVARKNA